MSPPGRAEGGPQTRDRPNAAAAKLQHSKPTVRQPLAATRVRQVVRVDLRDLVNAQGELADVEARARLCRLAGDVQPGQALVLDLGAATWTMPWTFDDLGSAVQDAAAVQVQGTRGAFVAEVAEQLEAALR